MGDDIIERLREEGTANCREAADTIDALRQLIAEAWREADEATDIIETQRHVNGILQHRLDELRCYGH